MRADGRTLARARLWSVAGIALAVTCVGGRAAWAQQDGRATPPLPRFSPSAYVQVLYTRAPDDEGDWAIRRLKFMADGVPVWRLRYHVQTIFKTGLHSITDDRVYLQDAYLVVPAGTLQVKVGQFVPPFGLERFQPDAFLQFVDRSAATNRLVPNGSLGRSFSRDYGVEAGWGGHGLDVSGGLFRGGGANMPGNDTGPLGVVRVRASPQGVRPLGLSWQAGFAIAARHDEHLDLSAQLPTLPKPLLARFTGRDIRVDGFVTARGSRIDAQVELLRVWLDPNDGAMFAARGVAAQLAVHVVKGVVVSGRYEHIQETRQALAVSGRWVVTGAAAVDVPLTPVRIVIDRTLGGGAAPLVPVPTWRIQTQVLLLKSPFFPPRSMTGQ